MKERQEAKRKMFVKVAQFGDDYAGDFPATKRSGQLLTRLDAIIERLTVIAPQQTGASGSTVNKDQALKLLEDSLEAVAQNARTAASTLGKPELRATLRLTPNGSESELITDADRFLNRFDPAQFADADEVKDEFIDLELPADFLVQLKNHKEDLEAAHRNQAGTTRSQTGATTSIATLIAEGMEICKTLDTICENRYGRNANTKDARKLREWRQARHIEAPNEAHDTTQTTNTTGP